MVSSNDMPTLKSQIIIDMFKKRNLEKKVDISRDLEEIQVSAPQPQQPRNISSESLQQRREEADNKQQAKPAARYGLIENTVEAQKEPQRQENAILKLYIRMRMQEINSKREKQVFDSTTSEILQMQKQYLSAGENKITEYDVKEVQKKLQKMATEAIKNELENRGKYMVDLLQNEHERMEYASKKELKTIKQERQRLQKEIASKYAPQGRRHYIEYVRQENLKNMK